MRKSTFNNDEIVHVLYKMKGRLIESLLLETSSSYEDYFHSVHYKYS